MAKTGSLDLSGANFMNRGHKSVTNQNVSHFASEPALRPGILRLQNCLWIPGVPRHPTKDPIHAVPSSERGTEVSPFTPQHWNPISLKGLQSIDETGHVTGLSPPALSSLGARNPESADLLLKSHVQKYKGAHFGK